MNKKQNLNIIIGKSSNLSQALQCNIEYTYLISSLDIVSQLEKINFKLYNKVSIIFNQFQKSTLLYNIERPIDYINRSLVTTSIVLDFIKSKSIKINKIIYSSSSSVYGKNIDCSESSLTNPMSLAASLKISNEQLIKLFCENNNIDYTITRIFNMYGGNDSFSVISKIIHCSKNEKVLNLINNGESLRDYIHIDDVVFIYKQLLNMQSIPLVNIGTSNGKSILYILNILKENGIYIKTKSILRDELKVSIANNRLLLSILGKYKFYKLENYILSQIRNENNK